MGQHRHHIRSVLLRGCLSVSTLTVLLQTPVSPPAGAALSGGATVAPDRWNILGVRTTEGMSYHYLGGSAAASPCESANDFLRVTLDQRTVFDYPSYSSGPVPTDLGIVELTDRPVGQSWPYATYCPGIGVFVGWLTPGNVLDVAAAIAGLVEQVKDDLIPPSLDIARNPAIDGLVGLDTWFWVANYGGEPVTKTLEAFPGFRIQVIATPSDVTWSFGDGGVLVSGFGASYDSQGSGAVTHRYHKHGSYQSSAEVTFAATYQINNGPPQAIAGAVIRSGVNDIRVIEAQALIRRGT